MCPRSIEKSLMDLSHRYLHNICILASIRSKSDCSVVSKLLASDHRFMFSLHQSLKLTLYRDESSYWERIKHYEHYWYEADD